MSARIIKSEMIAVKAYATRIAIIMVFVTILCACVINSTKGRLVVKRDVTTRAVIRESVVKMANAIVMRARLENIAKKRHVRSDVLTVNVLMATSVIVTKDSLESFAA